MRRLHSIIHKLWYFCKEPCFLFLCIYAFPIRRSVEIIYYICYCIMLTMSYQFFISFFLSFIFLFFFSFVKKQLRVHKIKSKSLTSMIETYRTQWQAWLATLLLLLLFLNKRLMRSFWGDLHLPFCFIF